MKFWTQKGGGAHCLTLRDQLQNWQESPSLPGDALFQGLAHHHCCGPCALVPGLETAAIPNT